MKYFEFKYKNSKTQLFKYARFKNNDLRDRFLSNHEISIRKGDLAVYSKEDSFKFHDVNQEDLVYLLSLTKQNWVFSERLSKEIEKSVLNPNFKLIEVSKLVEEDSGRVLEKYSVLQVCEVLDAIVPETNKFKQLVLDSVKLNDDKHIYRLKNYASPIVVSEIIKGVFDKFNFEGVTFKPCLVV